MPAAVAWPTTAAALGAWSNSMDDLIRARDDMLMRGWAMLCQVYADAHTSDSPFESRCRGMRLLAPVLAAYVSLEDEVRRLAEEE